MSNYEMKKVTEELKQLYYNRLLPIEKTYLLGKFNYSEILESEMNSKPTILLIGQYSTGKTTFIRDLIGMDYPEMHIGPEPTTDRFIAVVHGPESKVIKGNALTGVNDLPFSGLNSFGSGFLNKFCASIVPAPLLKQINIIDTPGVLSGEKQRTSRGYDFAKVSKWFAERSDMILLMFDPSKLDISDEFKYVIEELRPYEDKVHCVLNKADTLDTESLMRVYGALLWSMGKIFRGAEVTRVYVGSYKSEPNTRPEHDALFQKDKTVLMSRLEDLPKACGMRKVNEMVKRIRFATINVCLLGHLRSQMPYLWGKNYVQEQLIKSLPEIFQDLKRRYDLSEGDFPNIDEYRSILKLLDFSSFPHTRREVLLSLHRMLVEDIPVIMSHVHTVKDVSEIDTTLSPIKPAVLNLEKNNKETMLIDNGQHRSHKTFNYIQLLFIFLTSMISAILIGLMLYYSSLTFEAKSQYFTTSQIDEFDRILETISNLYNIPESKLSKLFH